MLSWSNVNKLTIEWSSNIFYSKVWEALEWPLQKGIGSRHFLVLTYLNPILQNKHKDMNFLVLKVAIKDIVGAQVTIWIERYSFDK